MLKGKCILVGITGGIAAYKICELIRMYKKNKYILSDRHHGQSEKSKTTCFSVLFYKGRDRDFLSCGGISGYEIR